MGLISKVKNLNSKIEYEKKQYKVTNAWLNAISNNSVIDENKIFFESFHGKSMVGDPYAIFKNMFEDERYQDTTFIWTLSDKNNITDEKYLKDKRVRFVKLNTYGYYYHLSTAKILINNTSFPPIFVKKEEQVYLNTWHGTPYKTLGKHMEGPRATHANITSNFLKSDFMIHGCEYTKEIMEEAHDIADIWTGNSLLSTPRFELTKQNQIIEDYLVSMDVDFNKETILYAPTWKGNLRGIERDFTNLIEDFKKMKENFPEKNILLKVHSLMYSRMNEEEKKYVIADKYDMNEIMYYVDTLITDYSSSFFDFAALNKKIIHYIPDLEKYIETRGLYLELDELPGIIARTNLELIEAIKASETLDYQKFNNTYNNLTNKLSIDELIDRINQPKLKINNDKENVIIYVGGFEGNGITKSFINLTKKWDYDKYNLIVIDKNKWRVDQAETLDNINDKVKFLYRTGSMILSREERVAYHKHLKNPSSTTEFEKKLIKKIFQREVKRMLGNIKIDYAIDFSGYMYFWSYVFINMDVKKKFIFQHNNMDMEYNKMVGGKQVHKQKLGIVFNIYQEFDKIIAVSKETMDINLEQLNKFYSQEKAHYIENFIDDNEINEKKNILSNELVSVQEKIENSIIEMDEKSERMENVLNRLLNNNPEIQIENSVISDKLIKVGYYGRISPEKGQLDFVEKLPEILKYYPRLIVIFAGTGPQKQELHKKIIELGVKENVIMAGYIKNPYALMNILDYTALFSHSEGQPMVLLESLVVGTASIASDIPGCMSVLQNKYGVCAENTVEGILKTLEYQDGLEQFDVIEYNQMIKEKYNKILI